MKVEKLVLGKIKIPLKKPFKTAFRTAHFVEDVVVKLYSPSGRVGYGSAAPIFPLTGETPESIASCIVNHIQPQIMGISFDSFEKILTNLHAINASYNCSARAAVEMALYDLYAQSLNLPLYQLLGGYRSIVFTDLTISQNPLEVMVADALVALDEGFSELKLKLGSEPLRDFAKAEAVRLAVGPKVGLSVDANQAWEPKQALQIIKKLETLNISFVEQPVLAKNISHLAFVTQHVNVPILADESVFTPQDALQIVVHQAANMINIKLAKAGGIFNALQILNIAQSAQLECLMGSLLESPIAITAAAHFAAAKKAITKCDLDSLALIAENPVLGGARREGNAIFLDNTPGLGIHDILDLQKI